VGYSSWSDEAYRAISGKRASASSAEIFRRVAAIDPLMDPRGLKVREARDSESHPNSVPIVVAFDVTGSMGDIPTRFAKDLLGKLMTRMVRSGWVTDPQVLFAAVGDAVSDRAPFQVGQFESGLEMDAWLTRIWLEGGGGDMPESYQLAHWFAAHHTATDAWEKRNKKGYCFTIGDASNLPLDPGQIERVFGAKPTADTSPAAVVRAARERWELFHVYVTRESAPDADIERSWRDLVGPGLLILDKTDAIVDLIGVVLGVREGNLDQAQASKLLVDAGIAAPLVARILEPLR
jgi:hypothetical protein